MKIIQITFFVLINLTLSINGSSFAEEQSGIEGKAESAGFAAFNVYELIDDIAKSHGLSYDAYTDSANHPGIENTKNLMLELISIIKQRKEDELAFLQDLHAKIEALPETATAEEYAQIHPWFIIPDGVTIERRSSFLDITKGPGTLAHINGLKSAAFYVELKSFDTFFKTLIKSISDYLYWRDNNKTALRLPSTSSTSIMKLKSSGHHWDSNTAESCASMMDLRIALLRLSAPFIRDICLQDEDCSFNLYTTGLDRIIFADELEEHSIDPDYLIELMDERCRKFNEEKEKFIEKAKKALSRQGILGQQVVETTKQDLLPAKFKTFLSNIIQKISAGHIAMPKPFGTKALLEAEEKARRTAAQKQLEANKKAAERAKKEAKRSRAALAKLSRNAGKKAAAITQQEEVTDLIETFNAVDIISEASAISTTVDIPIRVPAAAAAASSYLDDYSATEAEEFFVHSAAAAAVEAEGNSEFAGIYDATYFQKANFAKKAAASSHEESSKESAQVLCWFKHATEDRYVPSRTISLTSGQRRVLDAIRSGEKFSFTMDKFISFMEGLGITQQSRKGSHAHFSTPGRLPKIFVNPHGWTNTFGPGAMRGMLGLINNLSLGESSEYVD